MNKLSVFASLLVLALVAPSAAQAPDIVVTGSRLQETAQDFAAEIAAAPSAEDQYARWNSDLCVSVAGLAQAAAQSLVDHISQRANALGLRAGGVDCRPNLIIIFAPDSDRVAREIVDTRRDLLGYYTQDDIITAGREGLEAFANTPRAVRWWHVANTTTSDGRSLADTRSRQGRATRDAVAGSETGGGDPIAPAFIGNGFEGAEATRSGGSRTRRATRQDLNFVLVIVDAPRVSELPASAVADYIAMASLVQLNPDADMTPFSTVLNLFRQQEAGGDVTPSMTAWDEAYLEGLYAATREAANSRAQRAEIARRIVREVGE